MCLAIPMKIKKVKGGFAEVEADQLRRTVNIQLLSSVKIGDFVIVHAGFAIQKLDLKTAKENIRLIHEIR